MSKSKSSLSSKSSHIKTKGTKDTKDICGDLNIGDDNNIELQITSIDPSKSVKNGNKLTLTSSESRPIKNSGEKAVAVAAAAAAT
jgi:hypothetical protein